MGDATVNLSELTKIVEARVCHDSFERKMKANQLALSRWEAGHQPDNEVDELLPGEQRNGSRWRYWFMRNGHEWWRPRGAVPFTKLTGIPHDIVTWQVANDIDDGWPSQFITDGLLPVDWMYMVGWLPGGFIVRVEIRGRQVEVYCEGVAIGDPADMLEILREET